MSDKDAARARENMKATRALRLYTGVPRSLEAARSQDPTVGLFLGPYVGPGGGAVSDERGTSVEAQRAHLNAAQ